MFFPCLLGHKRSGSLRTERDLLCVSVREGIGCLSLTGGGGRRQAARNMEHRRASHSTQGDAFATIKSFASIDL